MSVPTVSGLHREKLQKAEGGILRPTVEKELVRGQMMRKSDVCSPGARDRTVGFQRHERH